MKRDTKHWCQPYSRSGENKTALRYDFLPVRLTKIQKLDFIIQDKKKNLQNQGAKMYIKNTIFVKVSVSFYIISLYIICITYVHIDTYARLWACLYVYVCTCIHKYKKKETDFPEKIL